MPSERVPWSLSIHRWRENISYVLDTMMVERQGICDLIGDTCCTVIPVHTGEDGNQTVALENVRQLRNEHVASSNWNTGSEKLWEWLKMVILSGIAAAQPTNNTINYLLCATCNSTLYQVSTINSHRTVSSKDRKQIDWEEIT